MPPLPPGPLSLGILATYNYVPDHLTIFPYFLTNNLNFYMFTTTPYPRNPYPPDGTALAKDLFTRLKKPSEYFSNAFETLMFTVVWTGHIVDGNKRS